MQWSFHEEVLWKKEKDWKCNKSVPIREGLGSIAGLILGALCRGGFLADVPDDDHRYSHICGPFYNTPGFFSWVPALQKSIYKANFRLTFQTFQPFRQTFQDLCAYKKAI